MSIQIPLSNPYLGTAEKKLVQEVLASGQLSLGEKTRAFEERVAEFVGVKYAVAVNSGTAGLHLLLHQAGIGPGDEVITAPFSFVASTNVILYQGAKPVFVDIDPQTFNIDTSKIEAAITKRTKAILPIDIFGYPANYAKIKAIAKKHKLLIIEDACEALGAIYQKSLVGSLGHPAVFAFYANKQITTGEGGIIVTNSKKQYQDLKSLSNQGRNLGSDWLEHDRLGFNYRLDEMSAALGVAQMNKLSIILKKRAQVAAWYSSALAEMPGITLPLADQNDSKRSWFVYVIQVKNQRLRDRLMKELVASGIQTKPYLPAIHLQPYIKKMFGFNKGDYPVTEDIAARSMALPFFTAMTKAQVLHVAQTLKQLLSS